MTACLTPSLHPAYATCALAKSSAGFDRLNQLHGASAPKSLGAFFTPEGFPFGGMQWEAFGLAGFRVLRSVNPLHAATIIFDRIRCRLVTHQNTDNLIMNVFTVRPTATLPELAEQARINAAQSHALIEAINYLFEDRDELEAQFSRITNLSWLLESLLEQQALVCGRLTSVAGEVGV